MPELLGELIGGPSAFVLILSRSAGLVWALAWLAGASAAGVRVRVAAAGVIAAAVAPMVGEGVAPPADPLALGARAVIEATVGAAMGIGAGLIAAAARLAGEIVGMQAGLSAASTLAPGADDGPTTPLATLGGLIAMATFAALDGPFRLMMALAGSYQLGPDATGALPATIDGRAIASAFEMVTRAMGLALRLAAPVALAMLVAQVAVGLLGRSAPALSGFATWLPARLALGLVLTLLGVAGLVSALASAWSATLPGG